MIGATPLEPGRGLSPRVRGNHPPLAAPNLGGRPIPACAGEPGTAKPPNQPTEAYPRVCGGTICGGMSDGVIPGLSPRVRGNPFRGRGLNIRERPIPACAGEPPSWPWSSGRRGAYPRVCGGTQEAEQYRLVDLGLSPRVRGNLNGRQCHHKTRRPIPACAGEPGGRGNRPALEPAYPRVCGGTLAVDQKRAYHGGLSPRVRGNRLRLRRGQLRRRPIPACAGEPSSQTATAKGKGAYPRVCGGTPVQHDRLGNPEGLSPRVRGNRQAPPPQPLLRGPIPACAGEPGRGSSGFRTGAAYPRVCGGTLPRRPIRFPPGGLSPRVRGNPGRMENPFAAKRPIPACAGEPPCAISPGPGSAAYPRVCGGTYATGAWSASTDGLSPRVRGNRNVMICSCNGGGPIPACAGEPRVWPMARHAGKAYPRVCGGTP